MSTPESQASTSVSDLSAVGIGDQDQDAASVAPVDSLNMPTLDPIDALLPVELTTPTTLALPPPPTPPAIDPEDAARDIVVNPTPDSMNGIQGGSKTVDGKWMDVALTSKTFVEAKCVYKNNAFYAIAQNEGFVELQTQDFERGFSFEPAKSYKFRVAAINAQGIGPWSEATAYRTLDPDLPGAPSTVRVTKADQGAHVSWEGPTSQPGTRIDYAVFLAVGGGTVSNQKQLNFTRVYEGHHNYCTVTKDQLQNAVVDKTGGKCAVIFRIAAKNRRGFGPATQVRWLQT